MKNDYLYNKEIDETYFRNICDKKYEYLPTILPPVNRIIGIGDIHGDLDLAINFLLVANVITEINYDTFMNNINVSLKIPIITTIEDFNKYSSNNNLKYRYFKWIGNDTYVVQVGDQIDRCRPSNNMKCDKPDATIEDENSDLIIMELFDDLHKAAKKCGGAVYSLIGNHEVMNFDGNFDYVSYKGINDYKQIKKSRNENFNKLREKFACTRNAIIIIGDFVFVHGGLASNLLSKYNVFEINFIIRKYIYDKFKNFKSYINDKNNKHDENYNTIKKI